MKRVMSPFFSPLLLFFLFVTAVFIVVNGKTELESNADDTSILVEQKSSDVNLANDSLKHVRDIEKKKTEEEEDEEDDGDGDGNNDGDEEKEEEEEDASGEIQEEEEEEEEEEYEGEERNEYEDELKALAESHEAMSKDETKDETRDERTNSNTNNSTAAKNFESHENVLENKSDEDVASNEAITDELPKKHEDKEVADLLRYKKEKDLRQKEEDGLRKKKKKRVPTVKKELSTQKEILLAGNETQVLKSLVPSEETFNGLNEETEQVKRGYFGENERAKDKRMSIIQEDSYWNMSNEIPEKFDNRQDISAKNFRSYILKKCKEEQENEEKLHESKDQKDNLVKCLLKFKKKLAKDLERWDKVHQFLMKVKAGLNYSKNMQDIEKKNYDGPLTTSSTVTEASQDEKERKKTKKKKKKKKMKKKKKLQDRRSTMTTITKVVTFPSTTTTMSPSTTTSVQWQLLAEKLFGPPWQENVRPESDDIAKIRYSVDSKPKTITSSSIRRFIDQEDATNNRKELNTERQPLLLQKAHQLPGKSNLFPFEKINTHRNRFDSQIDRLGEYNGPERVLQRLRFGQIIPPPRDFSREKDQEDYQDDDGQREEEITHNREYRPPNQNFAMSRSWPDIPLKYNNRPWKGDRWDGQNGRTKPSSLPNEWSWKQPQYNNNFWPARDRTWQSIRNYWTPLDNDYEAESDFVSKNRVDRNWRWRESQERRQRQRQEQEQDVDEGRFSYPWELEGPNVWPGSQSFQVKSPWSQTESSQMSKTHDNIERKTIATPWEDTKIRPYEPPKSTTKMARQYGKSKVSLPKISMATWNSLTSDPATWPYRSSDTKPWPKDENGKSYNPNADLVKKLGLDKDDGTIWQNKETVKTYKIPNDQWDPLQTNSKNSSNQENESIKRYKLPKDRFDFDIYDVKSKSMKDWTKPRSKENRQFEPLNDNVNNWYRDNEPKTMWSTKDALNSNLPKIQSVGAWDMPPDKSTWMPYRFEPQSDPFNENPTGPTIRRWFESNGSSSSIPTYAKHINGVELWSPKSKNVDLWNREYDLSQDESNISDRGSSRSNKVINWPFKFENDYSNKENYALWDRKRSFDKGQPENVDLGKGNHDVSSNDVPSLKANETNNGIDSSKETLSLHKPNNWNNTYERANSWPPKWKQFSYHRVTTLPISKPGTVSNISTKSRNAFVAVSAVASPKYAISKNDIVESQNNRRDLFEKQLEELRQQNSWSLKANAIEESIRSPTPTERLTIESTIGPTLTNITNFTSMVHRPEEEKPPKSANKEYQMHNK